MSSTTYDKLLECRADASASASSNLRSKMKQEQTCSEVIKSSSSKQQQRPIVVKHVYHDHANEVEEEPPRKTNPESEIEQIAPDSKYRAPRARGGVIVPFPIKLHRMLDGVEAEGLSHIVSWQPHGRAFLVHRPAEFLETVMPRYFRQSKITSFQRQLNLYGFRRITKGEDMGAYYHELFLRGRLFLAGRMMRTKIKGTGFKSASSPDTEPDFYQMPFATQGHAVWKAKRVLQESQVTDVESMQDVSTNGLSDLDLAAVSRAERVQSPAPITPDIVPKISLTELLCISPIPEESKFSPEPAPVTPCPDLSVVMTDEQAERDLLTFEGKQFHYLDSIDLSAPIRRSSMCAAFPPMPSIGGDGGAWTNEQFPFEYGDDTLVGDVMHL